ncbi:MAG: two-component system sensor histidine kinase NtrB [Fibrobacterota bacterium]
MTGSGENSKTLSMAGKLPQEAREFFLNALSRFEENTSKLQGAYNFLQDQFRRLNLELETKNSYLKSMLSSMPHAVIAVDNNCEITNFNTAAEKMFGMSSDEAAGKTADIIIDSTGENGFTSLAEIIKKQQMVFEENLYINRVDKEKIPVSYNASPIYDQNRDVIGAVAVIRDMSLIKEMEAEIQRSKTLAALGEMSAQVAHEIRNPLGSIGGFAAILDQGIDPSDENKEIVKEIIKAISRLNRVVSGLLIYTRPMTGSLRAMDITDQLRENIEFSTLGLGKSIHDYNINYDLGDSPVLVDLDPEKFQQIVGNIFRNAVKAMKGGGEITVSVSINKAKDSSTPLTLAGKSVPGVVRVVFSDTGCGVKKEDMKKLFTPFFTTYTDGNGLGLAITKKIVEMHKGEISVESAEGKGTSFSLSFPLSSKEKADA